MSPLLRALIPLLAFALASGCTTWENPGWP